MLNEADLAVVHCVRIGVKMPNQTALWIKTDAQLEEFARVLTILQEALVTKGEAPAQVGKFVSDFAWDCFDLDFHPVTMAHTPEGRNLSNGLSIFIDYPASFVHIEFKGKHEMANILEFSGRNANALVAELTEYTPSA